MTLCRPLLKTKSINVDIKHDYFVPNVFVPNGDGRNENFGPIGENFKDKPGGCIEKNKQGSNKSREGWQKFCY